MCSTRTQEPMSLFSYLAILLRSSQFFPQIDLGQFLRSCLALRASGTFTLGRLFASARCLFPRSRHFGVFARRTIIIRMVAVLVFIQLSFVLGYLLDLKWRQHNPNIKAAYHLHIARGTFSVGRTTGRRTDRRCQNVVAIGTDNGVLLVGNGTTTGGDGAAHRRQLGANLFDYCR
jgi:hypothetical protein